MAQTQRRRPLQSPAEADMHIDARSGFCAMTKTFRSLRRATVLPPSTLPLSFPSFAFALLPSPVPSHPALLDASTGAVVSFPALLSHVRSLAAALRSVTGIAKGDIALVLAPASLNVPILYLALLSLGAIVSPGNPVSTAAEIARTIGLCKPSFAFATAATAHKLPPAGEFAVVLLDSLQFKSFLHGHDHKMDHEASVEVQQSDIAAIIYSSGTTGLTKAAAISHRRLIVSALEFRAMRPPTGSEITLLGVPMFHAYGFHMLLRGVALGETTVVMTALRAGVAGILRAAARCRSTQMFTAPPVVVAMAQGNVVKDDLSALVRVDCGGAPLSKAAAAKFHEKFPDVELSQGYGSTEGGLISKMVGFEECRRIKSVGRLCSNVEAKIIDHSSGELLSNGQQGELCVRSPSIMSGYIGDDKANVSAFDSDGCLRTGDLCYFDKDGFLYIVDRLKELIKYKAYQVAPAELESVLQSIPEIFDAAVMPYPQEEVGQIPMALVVKQKGSNITEAEVISHVAKQVAPYKKIRKVVFVDSIPRSPSGKILRRALNKHPMIADSISRL